MKNSRERRSERGSGESGERGLGLRFMATAWAKSTTDRRELIKRQLRLAGDDPVTLVGRWVAAKHKPSTITTYTAVLQQLVSEEQRPTVKVALRAAKKRSTLQSLRRAVPLSREEMVLAIRSARTAEFAMTAVLLWATASRHCDLQAMQGTIWQLEDSAEVILQLTLGAHKSDVFGQRAVTKWLQLPTELATAILAMLRARKWSTYRAMLRHMKKIDKAWTVHSFRRGAATCLATAGFSMDKVIMMTGHTPTADPMLAGRRYVDPHPAQHEAKIVLRMAAILLEGILPTATALCCSTW